ncbi:MAG: hypothetical protein JNM25_00490 [Planctomycetes bacterium]|nr:hypothetical protein [Planctomycetota bacterium]
MGFFDWLRSRPTLGITCWLDDGSRARGFVRALEADRARGDRVLVVGQFPAALLRTGEQLAAAGIPFTTQSRWTEADTQQLPAQAPGTVVAVLARSLPDVPEGRARPQPPANAANVSVRLCDLHVLADENDRVERFARSLPARVRVAASVSFDDAIMAEFASPWVKAMMQRMGLKEDVPIDSPMVTKGLRRALQKLGKRATGNVPCDSVQEWMLRNLTT